MAATDFPPSGEFVVCGVDLPGGPAHRLAEKSKGVDPEVLKQITVFDFEDFNPQCPNDTSMESTSLRMPELTFLPRFDVRRSSLTEQATPSCCFSGTGATGSGGLSISSSFRRRANGDEKSIGKSAA